MELYLKVRRAVLLDGKPRARVAKASTGDLMRITGRVRQTSYEAEDSTRYGVDLTADGLAILAKASGRPAEDDAGENSAALAAARAAASP